MGEEDILMITADHGCDPGDTSTDHTREYVPLIIYGKSVEPKNFGTKDGFSTIARFVTKTLGVDYTPDGASELI
jgi:phosphopentomutase